MSKEDADRVKKLLKDAEKNGEPWPDEVNKILNRAKKVKVYGTVCSCGDGWGWYGK